MAKENYNGRRVGSEQKSVSAGTARKKKNPLVWLLPLLAVILLAAGAVWFLFLRVQVTEQVTLEAGSPVVLDLFFEKGVPQKASFKENENEIDTSIPGTYSIAILVGQREYSSELIVTDTIAPTADAVDLATWGGILPEASSAVTDIVDATEVTAAWKDEPDVSIDGEQTGCVLLTDLGGNTAEIAVSVYVTIDTTAPVISGVEDQTFFIGEEIDPASGVAVTDDLDEDPILTVDDSAVDTEKAGKYTIVYTAEDGAGNVSEEKSTLTLILDSEAPTIEVADFYIYLGDTVSYKNQAVVTDDYDEDPELKVDNSAVDLNTEGEYPVTYTATDRAGNSTSVTVTFTVKDEPEEGANEDYVLLLAEEVLDEITDDSMNQMQVAYAIYHWVRTHMGYTSTSDKSSWVLGAYNAFTKRSGDCYSYFAITKALLTAAGIENEDVVKVKPYATSSSHFWNLINVGTGWYHMDTTPFSNFSDNFFMLTDEELAAWDTARGWREHNFDPDSLPERATESVQDMINYSSSTLVLDEED